MNNIPVTNFSGFIFRKSSLESLGIDLVILSKKLELEVLAENTELGKVWTGIEKGVGQVYGEISGIRSRKSREAQAINRKIGEAKIIREKVDLLLKEINSNSASI